MSNNVRRTAILFPTLVIISVAGVVHMVFSLSERRLEQANLITKEKLPILKRSQNKPQTINDLQLISHLIDYNIACFSFTFSRLIKQA